MAQPTSASSCALSHRPQARREKEHSEAAQGLRYVGDVMHHLTLASASSRYLHRGAFCEGLGHIGRAQRMPFGAGGALLRRFQSLPSGVLQQAVPPGVGLFERATARVRAHMVAPKEAATQRVPRGVHVAAEESGSTGVEGCIAPPLRFGHHHPARLHLDRASRRMINQ